MKSPEHTKIPSTNMFIKEKSFNWTGTGNKVTVWFSPQMNDGRGEYVVIMNDRALKSYKKYKGFKRKMIDLIDQYGLKLMY